MTAPSNIYPLATTSGVAIPLDVIRPSAVTFVDFPNGSEESITLPTGINLAVFYADADCLVNFGSAIGAAAEDNSYPDCLFLPAGSVVTAQIPEGATDALVQGLGTTGRMVIQTIEKWASIGLTTQFTRK